MCSAGVGVSLSLCVGRCVCVRVGAHVWRGVGRGGGSREFVRVRSRWTVCLLSGLEDNFAAYLFFLCWSQLKC